MKYTFAAPGLVGVVLGLAGSMALAASDPPAKVSASANHDGTHYEAMATRYQRLAEFYGTRAKEYAAGTKPAVTAQARRFADLRDRYRRLAEQNRELAASAVPRPSE